MGNDDTLRTARNRRPHFVQIAKRLEDEQVDAALDQCLGLLAEVRLGFIGAHLAPWLDADTEGTDGSGHVRLVACRLAGDARTFDVDLVHTIAKAERPQLDSVRAERIGLQDVRARPDVVLVDFRHGVGRHDVQRIEAAVDEDALCIQHRPHSAVADEHTIVEGFKKRLHGSPGVGLRTGVGGTRPTGQSCGTPMFQHRSGGTDLLTRSMQTDGTPSRTVSTKR